MIMFTIRVYSHRASALTRAPTLGLMYDMNTLISIASFTPCINASVNKEAVRLMAKLTF